MAFFDFLRPEKQYEAAFTNELEVGKAFAKVALHDPAKGKLLLKAKSLGEAADIIGIPGTCLIRRTMELLEQLYGPEIES